MPVIMLYIFGTFTDILYLFLFSDMVRMLDLFALATNSIAEDISPDLS